MQPDLYFSEGGFLFDGASGLTYTLNRTGAFLMDRLRRGDGESNLSDALVREFEVTPPEAATDVRDFLRQLADFGIE